MGNLEFLGFPRLYAAASLKPVHVVDEGVDAGLFSAALCRGLIEAPGVRPGREAVPEVFRGFMSRPH